MYQSGCFCRNLDSRNVAKKSFFLDLTPFSNMILLKTGRLNYFVKAFIWQRFTGGGSLDFKANDLVSGVRRCLKWESQNNQKMSKNATSFAICWYSKIYSSTTHDLIYYSRDLASSFLLLMGSEIENQFWWNLDSLSLREIGIKIDIHRYSNCYIFPTTSLNSSMKVLRENLLKVEMLYFRELTILFLASES